MSAEPLTPEELADLAEAINRDYEFTHASRRNLNAGPAITAHLLYTIRYLGPRLLDHLSALSQELKAARERAESLDDRLEVALSGGAEYVQELSDQLEAAREQRDELVKLRAEELVRELVAAAALTEPEENEP